MHLTVPIEVKMDMDEIIERLKKDDFVPVVRCKDCKHSSWDELGKCYWCKGKERTADFYCADGERREDA